MIYENHIHTILNAQDYCYAKALNKIYLVIKKIGNNQFNFKSKMERYLNDFIILN